MQVKLFKNLGEFDKLKMRAEASLLCPHRIGRTGHRPDRGRHCQCRRQRSGRAGFQPPDHAGESANFETYKLPGIADVPEIDVVLINMPERGVIGIGEPATVPTAAAIANAVANALGVRVSNLPITPAKVLAALGKVPAVTV